MQRTFKSKVDRWYHLLVWGMLALVFFFFWNRQIAWAVTFLVVAVFLMEALLRTDYVFTGDGFLHVKCGFMPRYKIPLRDIREIRYVRSNRLAYALSYDRLMLITPYDTRMVSPDNPEDFIKEVRRHNHLVLVVDSRVQ